MTGGQEFDVEAGAVSSLPKGHEAWVVGDEDVVVDWCGASDHARTGERFTSSAAVSPETNGCSSASEVIA